MTFTESIRQQNALAVIPKSKFTIASNTLRKMIGLTRGDMFFRSEYDLEEIKAASETDSYLKCAIKKYTELFFKSGYVFRGINDKAIEYLETRFRLMSYMTDNAFDILLRETAYDLIKFSNAFWIKSRKDSIPFVNATGIVASKKCISGYFRVDPASMQIKFNKEGKVLEYRQVVNGREKKYSVDDVIHFTFDRDPGSEWGVPRWIAALEDIRLLRKAEGDILALMYRYAMPYFHAKIGLAQSGLYGTKKEIEDFKMTVERTPPDGMLITNERANIDVIGAGNNCIDMNPYINYFQDRVFTGLNVSPAMMGRSNTSSDADTMEQQVHNAVKDNQASFAVQFQHFVITELLLEGGFNPILNKKDIVNFCFNEINLDTKVKTENHEINKFQSNTITFEELRDALGYRKNSVDEERLYSRIFEQKNTIEQINLNHKNALELQALTHKNNLELARLNMANSDNNELNANGSSKSKSTKQSDKGKQYTKKNTGNGKNIINKGKSGATKSMDKPSNQYGTFNVKIKENTTKITIDEISNSIIANNNISMNKAYDKLLLIMKDTSKTAAKEGWNAALKDLKKEDQINKNNIGVENSNLIAFANSNLKKYFSDIKNSIGNITDRETISAITDKQKYRLHFLQDMIYRKAYWNSYTKACAINGVEELLVQCDDSSKHKDEHYLNIVKTNNFKLNEIPGFSANCKCYLVPIINNGDQ